MSKCVSCNKSLKGFFGKEFPDQPHLKLFEGISFIPPSPLCKFCYKNTLVAELTKIKEEKISLQKHLDESQNDFEKSSKNIEILTFPPSPSLEYEVKGFVSAHSGLGIGFMLPLYLNVANNNNKQLPAIENFKQAEEICLANLRLEAAKMEANCIAETRLTYSDVSGNKNWGAFLICAFGTAIQKKGYSLSEDFSFIEKTNQARIEMETLEKRLATFKEIYADLTGASWS